MTNSSFRILSEQGQLPTFETDARGITAYVSPVFSKLVGKKPEVVLGVSILGFFASEELESHIHSAVTFAKEEVLIFEVFLKNASVTEYFDMSLWSRGAGNGLQGILTPKSKDELEEEEEPKKIVQGIEQLLISQSGTPIFNTLALGLLNTLNADVVFIGELMAQKKSIDNISMATASEMPSLNSYELKNTPCAGVIENAEACYYPNRVSELFPEDEILREAQVEGYVGLPLLNSQGDTIGIIAALYKEEVSSPELVIAVLEMLASLVATEMEKAQVISSDLYRYKALINSMAEGVIFYATSGEVITHNRATEEILGISAEQVRQSNIFEVDWKALDEHRKPFSKEDYPASKSLLTQESHHNVVMGLKRSSGEEVWVNINTEPIWNDDGRFVGVVTTFFDVTELELAKGNLVKREEQFRYLFESMSEAIVIINQGGEIILANNAVRTCFGYKKGALIGKAFSLLVPQEHRKKQEQVLRLFFQLSDIRNYVIGNDQEILGLKENGMEIPIEINLTHLMIDQQPHVICSIRDMSHNKRYLQLETAYKKITDSVQYAKRIQMALLGGHKNMVSAFKDAFIFFSPKDVVSGDFYWYEEIQRLNIIHGKPTTQKLKILIISDCTGHGVPGAFMAALGNAFIHEIVNEHHIVEPHHILAALNTKIITTLQKQEGLTLHDGMDMGILVFDEEKNQIYFAGARHSLYMIRNAELIYIRGTGHSLGGKTRLNAAQTYERHVIPLQAEDRFYLSTDGFQDQFGGPNNKKYMRKKFKQLLLNLCETPMSEQESVFKNELESWRGEEEVQTDDVLVVGIEV